MNLSIDVTKTIRHLDNFWNHIHFHPTDAIEDAWGKRILDRVSADGAAKTVRMYAMLEDVVTMDEEGKLCYDFRLGDLRLDYMLEKGFDILLSYNFTPPCIASKQDSLSCVSHNKTRYKGKLINTSVPRDYALWEEICYAYTKHLVDRYGEETVARWHLQCYNEPDISAFFMSELPINEENTLIRLREYCKLYHSFEKGIRRASEKLCIGGPALANKDAFLLGFFDYVKQNDLQFDFISLHNYAATNPVRLQSGENKMSVRNNIELLQKYLNYIKEAGLEDKMLIVDEWGVCTNGFNNMEQYPALIFRENHLFATYYFKLLGTYIKENIPIDKMLLCLSGQHEMQTEFTGFRGFFTLNHIPKPIYHAYALAARMGDTLLDAEQAENLTVIPTLKSDGTVSLMMVYANENLDTDLPDIDLSLDLKGLGNRTSMKIWRIDSKNANPYAVFESMGKPETLSEDDIKYIREQSRLSPTEQKYTGKLDLHMSNHAVVLVEFYE
jgi:xylan 1,4-beta-xylosidase